MGIIQRVKERIPKTPTRIPRLDDFPNFPKNAREISPRIAFLDRRIRLGFGTEISVPLGTILLLPCFTLFLILFISIKQSSDAQQHAVQLKQLQTVKAINETYDKVFVTGCLVPDTSKPRANAAIVVLARNKELEGVIQSMKSFERHFNRWYHYPYVFLNDGEFNSTFRETIRNYTSSTVEFGRISDEMWGFPEWVEQEVAKEGIRKQDDAAIMYGGMESYHHMCRFYSGFFFNHELLQKYEWYWRLEPEIKYFCDITYDPFLEMIKHNKTYGYTIVLKELRETVPNLFRYAAAHKRAANITSTGLWNMFVEEKPDKDAEAERKRKEDLKKTKEELAIDRAREEEERLSRLGEPPRVDAEAMEGESYNMCHFWSNFEIARLDFFRSKQYEDFFQTMDRSGGFWNERWGDAPIHSLALGMFLERHQVHYFRDIGYRHTTIQHCPVNAPSKQLPRPPYIETTTLDEKTRIAEDDYWEDWDKEQPNGVGCRCRCDIDVEEVEGKEGSCTPEWVKNMGGWLPDDESKSTAALR